MDIYLDAEFDAVYHEHRFMQCVISVGLLAVDEDEVNDTLYTLVRPRGFRHLTRIVKRMTGLSNEELRKAPDFCRVMDQINAFIHRYQKQGCIYSFGSDDMRTLKKQAVYEQYQNNTEFQRVIDLQAVISREIKHEGEVLSSTLSLADLKYLYGLKDKVAHNALQDAYDLFCIHKAYRHKELLNERVVSLAGRKQQRQAEARQRSAK